MPSCLLPRIHEGLTLKRTDGRTLILEVQQHIGEDMVRTVAMDSTDGLTRGMEVTPMGQPITMPTLNIITEHSVAPKNPRYLTIPKREVHSGAFR